MKIYIIKKLILYMRNKEHIIIILGVILILIGFISFVIWLFIFYEENNSDYVDLKFVVDDSSWDDMNKLSELTVERGYDDANITGFNLIFDFEKGSVKHFVEELIDKGEKKVIKLNFSNFEEGNLVSIKIVPVFDGKEGRVTDEMLFEVIPKNNLGWNTDFDIPVNRIDNVEKTCIPTKTCGDYACGSRLFDGCRNILNCDCPTGKTCVDNMCVVCNVTKTCQDYNNEGRCGSELFDGCRNILNCDCPTGKTCANGMCVNVTEKCSLKTCINYSGQCGNLDDGCGGTINCGCESGECVGGICILPPSGTTYYIDAVSGSDTNTGQSSSPWKTMSKVKSSAQANSDIIILNWNDALVSEKWPTNQKFKSNKVYQYGIEWTFEKTERIGRFINGDFWAANPAGVKVTKISPNPTGTRHGSMINPKGSEDCQAYDSRGNMFCSSKSIIPPHNINPGSSLISSISKPEGVTFPAGERGRISDAAVLTILSSVPDINSFRPPYAGNDKPLYIFDSSRMSLLPKLPKVSDTPALSTAERWFQRVWLDHISIYHAQHIHPQNNMPDYGRDISKRMGDGSLMILLDENQIGDKTNLAIYLIQNGIDNFGVHKSGGTTTNTAKNGPLWSSNGAHSPGKKWPILFAGIMLNNNEIKAIGQKSGDYLNSGSYRAGNFPPDYIRFHEDDQTFYIDQFMVDLKLRTSISGTVLGVTHNTLVVTGLPKFDGQPHHQNVEIISGPGAGQVRYITGTNYNRLNEPSAEVRIDLNESWKVMPVVGSSVYQFRGHEPEHIGIPEYGITYANEPSRGAPSWEADYRSLNIAAYSGWILSANILKDSSGVPMRDLWNHNALFDYSDRAFDITGGSTGTNGLTRFGKAMWVSYRNNYGCRWVRDNPSSINSQGHYVCGTSQKYRCDWQANPSSCTNCITIKTCNNYGTNQRAKDYDPCSVC
jgi:hypothetical protein